MLLQIQRLVQVFVDEMELRGFRANVVCTRRHANQVHLVEGEAFGADPGVFGVVLAVMEDFTTQQFIGVITGAFAYAIEFRLREQYA